jgi:hypothetical protein
MPRLMLCDGKMKDTMSTNYLYKSVLGLIAAVAISANLGRAGAITQPRAEAVQPGPFQNLVTDKAALEAWNKISGKQAEVHPKAVPLAEFTQTAGNAFHNQFDIIWPSADRDPSTNTVTMRLKDVRAIEIFNAMNLYFEAQNIPARWRLALNGKRPTAILTTEKSQAPSTPSVEPARSHTVFSIADYLYATSPDLYKQSAADLAKTLEAVCGDISSAPQSGPQAGLPACAPVINVHAEAGILVFTGAWEQTQLVHSTLEALKDARLRKADALAKEEKANLEAVPKELR